MLKTESCLTKKCVIFLPEFCGILSFLKCIFIKEIDEMWGLGTPEDLEVFLSKKLTTNL